MTIRRASGLIVAMGMIVAMGLVDAALEGDSVFARTASAAPLGDVLRFRPAQATTSTATPIIRLTPDTPTPRGGAGTPGQGTVAPGETLTPAATSTVRAGSSGGTSGPGSSSPGDGTGGVMPGQEDADQRATEAARTGYSGASGISPPVLPDVDGASEPGSSGSANAAASDAVTRESSEETSGGIVDEVFVRRVGPLGASVAIDDPAAAELWRDSGSPQAGRSWRERFTEHRPGPWSWWAVYPLLVILFLAAAWRVVSEASEEDGG